MSKFIEVTDSRYGDKLLINIEAIAWVHEDSSTVCFSGVHGEGNGLRSFDEKNMEKILKAIEDKSDVKSGGLDE